MSISTTSVHYIVYTLIDLDFMGLITCIIWYCYIWKPCSKTFLCFFILWFRINKAGRCSISIHIIIPFLHIRVLSRLGYFFSISHLMLMISICAPVVPLIEIISRDRSVTIRIAVTLQQCRMCKNPFWTTCRLIWQHNVQKWQIHLTARLQSYISNHAGSHSGSSTIFCIANRWHVQHRITVDLINQKRRILWILITRYLQSIKHNVFHLQVGRINIATNLYSSYTARKQYARSAITVCYFSDTSTKNNIIQYNLIFACCRSIA